MKEDIKKLAELGWEEVKEVKEEKEKKTKLPFFSWEEVFSFT